MENYQLVKTFIENSDSFYDDLKSNKYDSKHHEIVFKAYKEMENDEKSFSMNFRNWAMQSDLAVPLQLNTYNISKYSFFTFLAKYIYRKIFQRIQEEEIRNSFSDDLYILKQIGADNILKENPVHLSPGKPEAFFIDEISINHRWLRYIYMTHRIIEDKLLQNGDIWLDVGSYYGGFQGIVKKYFPKARYILVDFHHQLCRSFVYLSQLYPSSTHILPNQFSTLNSLNKLPENSFTYVPVSEFKKIKNEQVHLSSNIFSLGEMTRESCMEYLNSNIFLKANKVLLINRYKSSPFFEKTYESDISVLDYFKNNRKIKYFDVFPMGHFMLDKRKIFGKLRARNTSSSYFELITSLN